MRGGAGAIGRGTKLDSVLGEAGLDGAALDGEAEFSSEPVADSSLRGTSAGGLDGASSGGRGRGSGAENALRG